MILILLFQLFPNVTRKVGAFVGPLAQKKDTNLRKAIPAAERLMLTMRFLASGDSQVSLSYLFRMGKKGVSRIVSETSEAIIQVRMTIPIH